MLARLQEKINFKENKIRHTIGFCILTIQIIASVVAMVYISKLNILPTKYYVAAIAILVVCAVVTLMLNLTKKVHILGKIFGILMSVALIAVCYYGHHSLKMLKNITDEHYDVDTYVLVTLKDSEISTVADMADKSIGVVNNMNNADSVNSAISQLKKDAITNNITAYAYEDMVSMAEALYEGEVDAILYNKSLDEIISEFLTDYPDRIKVVSEFEVKTLISSEKPTYENPTQAPSKEQESETSTENEIVTEKETASEPQTEADNIKNPVYDPSRDPNAPGGGGYIGGDNTVDNASKGPITDRCFNIYISGIDQYGKVSGRSRSDVNLIVTVNPMTKEILITNTPRDYYVPIPGITTGNWRDKLTHAGIYGVWSSVAALENIYGIQIDYYVRVNFTSFLNMVDALGGIEVYSDYDFTTIHGGYHYVKGMNTLTNSKQALGFARERYAFPSGDHQRGRNQMALLTGMINKAMSPAILTNFTDLVNSVSSSVQTNMTMDEISALVKMQLNDGSSWTITQQAASGSGGSRICYSAKSHYASVVLPNQASIDACKAKINSVLN